MFTQIESLSTIFRNLKTHVHQKVMDTFSNGFVFYAFYFKKPLKCEEINMIEKSAMILLSSSKFLSHFYTQQKLTCEEFKYAQICYNYTNYFLFRESEDVDALVDHLQVIGSLD